MAFRFVDRIVVLEEGQRIVTHRSVLHEEEYLRDHFPRSPIMPGVLMLECMVQAATWLLRVSTGFTNSIIWLKEAKNIRYAGLVRPGETLVVEATLDVPQTRESQIRECWFRGTAARTNDPTVVVNARLKLCQSNLAENDAEMHLMDEQLKNRWKQQFRELWQPAHASVSA